MFLLLRSSTIAHMHRVFLLLVHLAIYYCIPDNNNSKNNWNDQSPHPVTRFLSFNPHKQIAAWHPHQSITLPYPSCFSSIILYFTFYWYKMLLTMVQHNNTIKGNGIVNICYLFDCNLFKMMDDVGDLIQMYVVDWMTIEA